MATIDYIDNKDSYLISSTCSIIDCSVERRLCDNLAPCSTIHLKLQLNDYRKNIDKDVNYYIENWCINQTTISCYYDNKNISTLSLDKLKTSRDNGNPLIIYIIIYILLIGILTNIIISMIISLFMIACFMFCNCSYRITTFN